MKNKSKLKKIREKKAGTATVTKEWLYMNPNSITVAEIENALEGMDGIETEIWKEAGVFSPEYFDPEPYLKLMDETGYEWHVMELPVKEK